MTAVLTDIVEDCPEHRSRLQLAEVVDPDVPLVARAPKDVCIAAQRVVPFEDEDALAAVLGQQRCRPEAADSGTDHDGVVRRTAVCPLVGF